MDCRKFHRPRVRIQIEELDARAQFLQLTSNRGGMAVGNHFLFRREGGWLWEIWQRIFLAVARCRYEQMGCEALWHAQSHTWRSDCPASIETQERRFSLASSNEVPVALAKDDLWIIRAAVTEHQNRADLHPPPKECGEMAQHRLLLRGGHSTTRPG